MRHLDDPIKGFKHIKSSRDPPTHSKKYSQNIFLFYIESPSQAKPLGKSPIPPENGAREVFIQMHFFWAGEKHCRKLYKNVKKCLTSRKVKWLWSEIDISDHG
jgi:hypothetical protein